MARRLIRLAALLLWARVAWAGELRVFFLDVGQGDAALIVSPTGKRVLIDGGPAEAGARLAQRLGGKPLDLVLLTHRHADHLGGLLALFEHPGLRRLLDAPFSHPSPLYARLIELAERHHVEVRDATDRRSVDLGGGARLTLLGPPEPPLRGTRSDVNANSVSARIDYKKMSVLFCADAEAPTERWLLAAGVPLAARVVKVPHHGSRHSSTPAFVRAVRPEAAVVSAGASNDYGHPNEQTLARWAATGARLYRTDRDGEIVVQSDGESFTVRVGRRQVAR